ncbi:MAG: type II toxin-antitoxin system Phd/YefM family antitoxin [Rhodobacteraceae bacterium]|nr:type II toxin-antitoxin system Phd/YefM family antitoxin [Paracoccaceae bacterium]
MKSGPTYTLPVSSARARLSEIVLKVQDPRSSFILTRHGKPVAAVVSMEELNRIWSEQEIADILANRTPVEWVLKGLSKSRMTTPHAAAEKIRKVQMDRKAERAILEYAGMEPVEGGEVGVEVEEVRKVVKRKRWWGRFGRLSRRLE